MRSEENHKKPSTPTASDPEGEKAWSYPHPPDPLVPSKGEGEVDQSRRRRAKTHPNWKKFVKNPWARVTVYLSLLIFGGCMFADRAFYVPSETHPIPPRVVGYSIVEHTIPIGEEHLSAWVLEPDRQPSKGTVLYSHGNAGNLENHLGFADFIPLNGYRMVMYDYRGYGASTGGPPTREKTIEDTHAALDWTLENFGPTWMVGQSLGASLSIWVAGERSEEIEGVIAIAPFTSYRAIARDVMGGTIVLYPLKWPLSFLVSSGGDPIERVGGISPKPILFVHGEADEIIPNRMSDELFAAAEQPKVLKKIPGMGHNDGWRSADRSFSASVLDILDSGGAK